MLNIVCLNAGDYQGHGAKYVNRLHDMVRRNLAEGFPGRFVCFTDDPDAAAYNPGISLKPLPVPGLGGWWNKLALFKADLFPAGDRVLFLDLDTVIAGRLDEIAAYDGPFAILRDFLRPRGWQSSVMAWPAGFGEGIWTAYDKAGRPEIPGGDQAWIEAMISHADVWQDLFPGRFVSYKQSRGAVPETASVVVFHGEPRPHQVLTGWVREVWKVGGLSRADLDVVCNTGNARLLANIEAAAARDLPWFDFAPDRAEAAVIVGGGPSLAESRDALVALRALGCPLWALNGAHSWLVEAGLAPDVTVLLDARPETAAFVTPPAPGTTYLVASQCDPAVFEALAGAKVVLFHNQTPGAVDLLARIAPREKPVHLFAAGTTVGMKALALARRSGHRAFHLYGMDSSYCDGAGHAYPQPQNAGEPLLDVLCGTRTFRAAPWMVTQVADFQDLARTLVAEGCTLAVAGDGLLAEVARQMAIEPPVIEGRFQEIGGFLWPLADRHAARAILAEVEAVPRVVARCRGRALAVQAGGNVGVFAHRLAEHFARVVTFEPEAENYACLARNLAGLGNVDSVNAAVGDGSRDSASLIRSPDNAGAHCLAAGGGEGERAALVALDNLKLTACDLIWLDIEGYELFALKGAAQTIARFAPVIVVEEKGLGTQYGVRQGSVAAWLAERGYVLADRFGRDVLFEKPAAAVAAA
ncbi:MAG: FkbM family methyltransferase [Bauldia sp.]